ncbi:hypothetical protein DNL40_06955 [Xylanimonas oleitrophica]|uniref:Uncharacterized protein n=1 Tax=Xylanimonas oleitrophica TaxID=2607479 RepID=A0A2W5Y6J7_9MICO|nr:hypothetical protein [Xylanimonas oleitrophica]PZR53844.1 hypothetical protein DNL40_06955 [Xylanimonas oleitrophica]
MSTEGNPASRADASEPDEETRQRVRRLLAASSGRVSQPRPPRHPEGDPRVGGDPSKAPTSLSAAELHPIEGDSSGTSWDDPREL